MTDLHDDTAVSATPQIDTTLLNAQAVATLLPLVKYLQTSHARLEKENGRLRAQNRRQWERLNEEIDRSVVLSNELSAIDDRGNVIEAICAHIDEAVANATTSAEDSPKIRSLREKLQRKTEDYDDAVGKLHESNEELEKAEKKLALVSEENEALREAVRHAEDESEKSARGHEQKMKDLQAELERAKSDPAAAAAPADTAELVEAASVLRHLDQGIALFEEDGEKSLRLLKRARAALTVSDGKESA